MMHDPSRCTHECPLAALRATFELGCCRSIHDEDDAPGVPHRGPVLPFIPGGMCVSAEVGA